MVEVEEEKEQVQLQQQIEMSISSKSILWRGRFPPMSLVVVVVVMLLLLVAFRLLFLLRIDDEIPLPAQRPPYTHTNLLACLKQQLLLIDRACLLLLQIHQHL